MKKLLCACAFFLFLVSCADKYQTVDCIRSGFDLVTIGPHDSLAKISIGAYERASNFSKLVKENTYQLNQLSPFPSGYNRPIKGKDTLDYDLVQYDYDFFMPKPDDYDWKFTNQSTGKVYLVTEIEQRRPTSAKIRKGDPPCYTPTINYKVNGMSTKGVVPYTLVSERVVIIINL